MNGFELYKELRKKDEKVRACFLTASEMYHESLRVPPQTLNDVKCFIPKPISIDDFIKRIEEELSR
jgi:DNA-binding response OmpR family regulator